MQLSRQQLHLLILEPLLLIQSVSPVVDIKIREALLLASNRHSHITPANNHFPSQVETTTTYTDPIPQIIIMADTNPGNFANRYVFKYPTSVYISLDS